MTKNRAAFINALSEEGTKEEAIAFLQKYWDESCVLRANLMERDAQICELQQDLRGAKPVAWRWRVRGDRNWNLSPRMPAELNAYCEIEPLYTASTTEQEALDLAFCREAMRHADIDLSTILPAVSGDMQKSIRKTLDLIDEARKRTLPCSGCAGITHTHTCGDPARQPQLSTGSAAPKGALPIACKADTYAQWCDECNTHPSNCKLKTGSGDAK